VHVLKQGLRFLACAGLQQDDLLLLLYIFLLQLWPGDFSRHQLLQMLRSLSLLF